jgi:flagellar biosynthesis protein FlhB
LTICDAFRPFTFPRLFKLLTSCLKQKQCHRINNVKQTSVNRHHILKIVLYLALLLTSVLVVVVLYTVSQNEV